MRALTSSELDAVRNRLSRIATGIETTDIDVTRTSIDFNLFSLRGGERKVEDEKMFGNYRPGDDKFLPGQRSGGLYKSCIVLGPDGDVVEYNIRLPPLSRNHGKGTIHREMYTIFDKFDAQSPGVEKAVMVRAKDIRDETRDFDETDEDIGLGFAQGEEYMVHVRAFECDEDLGDVLDLTEFVLEEFEKRHPDCRSRAPDTDPSTPDRPVPEVLDDLRSEVGRTRLWKDDGGRYLTFSLWEGEDGDEWDAPPVSTLTLSGNEVSAYGVSLPPFSADEYGRILLRKAIEHVVEEQDILTDGERRISVGDAAYLPEIQCDECERSLDAVVGDILAFVEAQQTVDERSQIA